MSNAAVKNQYNALLKARHKLAGETFGHLFDNLTPMQKLIMILLQEDGTFIELQALANIMGTTTSAVSRAANKLDELKLVMTGDPVYLYPKREPLKDGFNLQNACWFINLYKYGKGEVFKVDIEQHMISKFKESLPPA
jgi:hypothetical protein